MARTPSMTPAQAEALLGARGSLVLTGDNRGIAKKWLSAMGIPATGAATMPYRAIAECYNDTTNATLNSYIARIAADKDDEDEPQSPTPVATTTPSTTAVANDGSAGATLATLVAPYITDIVNDSVMAKVDAKLANVQITEIKLVGTPHIQKTLPAALRHKQFEQVLRCLAIGHNVMLVGPAGSGKTTLTMQLAEALELEYGINGKMTGAHELLGYEDGYGKYHTTPFRHSYEHGRLHLCDEMDGSDPSVPDSVNSAIDNGYQAFPDSVNPVLRHPNFRLLAACNTYGHGADRIYVNRNMQDGALLDRFTVIDFNYDEDLERTITGNDKWCEHVQRLRKAAFALKERIIISPRASKEGAQLLAANFTWSEVEDMRIWKGADADMRRRIETKAKSL